MGHDWGGILAWHIGAEHADRLMSLTIVSTPHPDALFDAIESDEDQAEKSRYIAFFRLPGGVAEAGMLANGAERLRAAYRGKLAAAALDKNVERLSEDGALTAALNWYRQLDMNNRIGTIAAPTLFIWGSDDHALGRTAALATRPLVTGPYQFEQIDGASHWLLDEAPARLVPLLLHHLRSH